MEGLNGLAAGARLRVGFNTGNHAILSVAADGTLTGPAPRLAHALAAEMGLEVEEIRFDGAPAMAEAAVHDIWDICFLAHDPARRHLLDWSRPYLRIEAAFAGRPPLPPLAAVDRKGVTILSAKATAYDLHLSRSLQHASLIPAATVSESHARFRAGEADFVAGIRASLTEAFGSDPSVAIMDAPFATVGQTIAVPRAKAAYVPLLDAFLDRVDARKAAR